MASDTPRPASGFVQKFVYWMVKNSALLLGLLYNRLERRIIGEGHFDGPALIVSNHQSNMDPPLIGASMPVQSYFLAKKELFDIPILGWIIATCNAIPLDRGGVDRAGLKRAIEVVRNGGKLVIYPEGTRSLNGELGPGKPGAGMIGAMAGVKCVPAFIDGSGAAMPRGATIMRPHKIRIAFGEPFDLPERAKEMSAKEYYQLCADEMMDQIARVRDQVLCAQRQVRRAA